MSTNKLGQSSKTRGVLFYGGIIVAVSLLIATLDYGVRISFGIFFKPMLDDFGWSRGLTSGSLTLSMLFQGAGAIVMGRLNDKIGPRLVMTLSGALLGIGYLLMAAVNSIWQLYLFYGVIIGIGMGGVFVALLSTVSRWFVKMRGLMTGITISGIGLGTLIISPLASWLISVYNWRTSYLILGGAVLVIGVLLTQLLKRDPSSMGLSPYGDVVQGTGLPVFPAETGIQGRRREGSQEREAAKSETPSGDQGFSFRESIRTRQYWLTVFTFFCLGYIIMGLNTHLVPHLTDLGLSDTLAANIFAVSGAISAIGCIIVGSTADRVGSRRACIVCFLITTGTVIWLTQITAVWVFFLFAAIYGISSGGITPLESTLAAELFGMKAHGAILGTFSFGFTVGGAIGPLSTGYLFDIKGNYELAFFIVAGFSTLGLILLSLLTPPLGKQSITTIIKPSAS